MWPTIVVTPTQHASGKLSRQTKQKSLSLSMNDVHDRKNLKQGTRHGSPKAIRKHRVHLDVNSNNDLRHMPSSSKKAHEEHFSQRTSQRPQSCVSVNDLIVVGRENHDVRNRLTPNFQRSLIRDAMSASCGNLSNKEFNEEEDNQKTFASTSPRQEPQYEASLMVNCKKKNIKKPNKETKNNVHDRQDGAACVETESRKSKKGIMSKLKKLVHQ